MAWLYRRRQWSCCRGSSTWLSRCPGAVRPALPGGVGRIRPPLGLRHRPHRLHGLPGGSAGPVPGHRHRHPAGRRRLVRHHHIGESQASSSRRWCSPSCVEIPAAVFSLYLARSGQPAGLELARWQPTRDCGGRTDRPSGSPAARRPARRGGVDRGGRSGRCQPTVSSMRAITSSVSLGSDVEGAQVLVDLLDPAGPGDHRRHVRVLGAPGDGQLGQGAVQLVGDRLERPDLLVALGVGEQVPAATRSRAAWPATPSGTPSRYLPVSRPELSGLQVVRPSPMSS